MMKSVGLFDIGGTAIKSGLYRGPLDFDALAKAPELLYYSNTPTPKGSGGQAIASKILSAARGFGPLNCLAVATAGQVDVHTGAILYANQNIPDYTGFPLGQVLRDSLKCPVAVENDGHAAALGEASFGAGKDFRRFLCLTYGTGVGGAIVQDRKIVRGSRGLAGCFGSMITRSDLCGKKDLTKGFYETHSSVGALVREALKIDETLKTGRDVFQRRFEPGIKDLLDKWQEEVAIGLAGLVHCFDPEAALLGGGLMEQDEIVRSIGEKLKSKVMADFSDIKVLGCSLGNKAGLYGMLAQIIDGGVVL